MFAGFFMSSLSLPDFSKAKILVFGDVMLDGYWHGDSNRVSPEAPVPVVKVDQMQDFLGGAANVAANCASLGVQTHLLGVIGQDQSAKKLKSLLDDHNIQHTLLESDTHPTIRKIRVIAQQQQLLRMDFEKNFEAAFVQVLKKEFEKCVQSVDMVIISDYAKGTLGDIHAFIALAKKYGKKVLVDPKSKDYRHYQGADLITPNRHEFELAFGASEDFVSINNKAQDAMAQFNIDHILITLGADGMLLTTKQKDAVHVPTKPLSVFDVTGAGDTVVGVLAASYAAGLPLSQSIEVANMAASIVVGYFGAVSVTVPQLQKVLQRDNFELGVLSKDQLLEAVAIARSKGEKIVMTNGCFDIIHSGHAKYLQEARHLGDRLIVAINADASIQKLKGPTRPINKLEDRLAVMAAMRPVTWVVAFEEETPKALLKAIKPDVLVKGGDYQADEVVGHEIVTEYGGEVKVLSLMPGRSTTQTISRIMKQES